VRPTHGFEGCQGFKIQVYVWCKNVPLFDENLPFRWLICSDGVGIAKMVAYKEMLRAHQVIQSAYRKVMQFS
jgi:hypothetical protein